MLYSFFKKILKNILPQKFIFENEILFRLVLYPLYKGSLHCCNICNTKLKQFEVLQNGDLLCPICGSISRTRRLDIMLEEDFLKPGFKVLDFSPSRALYRKLKKNKDILYFPTDFENEFLANYHFDITNIEMKSETFNMVICYHILEHIENDRQAIFEIFRVLESDGLALIQSPFKEGETYEDASMASKEERLKHFGQEDHVRIYSLSGLCQRLEHAGFNVEVIEFESNEYFGLKSETVVVAQK